MAIKTNMLIIGGGSIGLNSAYYAQKAGRQVTIIDSGEIGVGSSAGNAGHIVPSHIIPLAAAGMVPQAILWMLNPKNSPFSMRFSLNPTYLWWLARFASFCTQKNIENGKRPLDQIGRVSYDNFATLIKEENISCSYAQNGLLFLYTNPKTYAAGIHEGDYMRKNGVSTEVYDRAALKVVEPLINDRVLGGVHYTGDASLNPAAFLAELKKIILDRGAEAREHETVSRFEVIGSKVTRVITDKAEYEPDTIVLSAGAWTPRLQSDLRIRIPIQPAKGYSVTYKAPNQMPHGALILGEKRVAITPMGDKLRFTGRLELSDLEQQVDMKKVADIANAAREYLDLEPSHEIETWAGLRPTTPDGLPIIAKPKNLNNLIVAAGHAMLGLSLGPGTGQLVSEMANGNSPAFDLTPFRLERF